MPLQLISRWRASASFALKLGVLAFALAGCSMDPHDSIDAKPPPSMPLPATTTATPAPAPAKTANVPAPPSEADLGMPIYPGAKTYTDRLGAAQAAQTHGDTKTALLETPDSIDAVADFYKERLKDMDESGKVISVTPEEQKTPEGKRQVILTGRDSSGIRMVEVREGDGKTMIELMHLPAASLPTNVPAMSGKGSAGSSSSDSSGGPASSVSGPSSPAASPASPPIERSPSGAMPSNAPGIPPTLGGSSRP